MIFLDHEGTVHVYGVPTREKLLQAAQVRTSFEARAPHVIWPEKPWGGKNSVCFSFSQVQDEAIARLKRLE